MNIPTDAIVMTVVLIAGFIYFKMQKENKKPKETQSDEEEWQTFIKNHWDKISIQYRGYLLGLFLYWLLCQFGLFGIKHPISKTPTFVGFFVCGMMGRF